MSKPVIIVIAILVLALAGYLGYSQMQKGGTNPIQQAVEKTGESITKGTIKSLLSANKNVTCKTTAKDQSGTGTVYIAGTKMRGDFSSQFEGKSMMSHVISDDKYSYMWSDDEPKGTKFKYDPNEPEPSVSSGQGQEASEDLNEEVEMNCSSWFPDNSKFIPPSNIEFTDMSQMMENVKTQNKTQVKQAPDGPMKLDSSLCDSIEDADAKAQCLNALGN